jgi:hypothetical protein
MQRLDPESIDLALVARALETAVGATALGAIVGRTRLRDAVVGHLDCSMLEAEQIVDTMIGRGFLVLERTEDGLDHWVIRNAVPRLGT